MPVLPADEEDGVGVRIEIDSLRCCLVCVCVCACRRVVVSVGFLSPPLPQCRLPPFDYLYPSLLGHHCSGHQLPTQISCLSTPPQQVDGHHAACMRSSSESCVSLRVVDSSQLGLVTYFVWHDMSCNLVAFFLCC